MPSSIRKSERQKTIRVPESIALAVQQFNSGLFFECHETFEEVWQYEPGQLRDFYKGLIQIAAGFVHVQRGNAWGAITKLRSGSSYLEPYRPSAMGVDVDQAIAQARKAADKVDEAGDAALRRGDFNYEPRWSFDPDGISCEAVRWKAWCFDAQGRDQPMEITVFE